MQYCNICNGKQQRDRLMSSSQSSHPNYIIKVRQNLTNPGSNFLLIFLFVTVFFLIFIINSTVPNIIVYQHYQEMLILFTVFFLLFYKPGT